LSYVRADYGAGAEEPHCGFVVGIQKDPPFDRFTLEFHEIDIGALLRATEPSRLPGPNCDAALPSIRPFKAEQKLICAAADGGVEHIFGVIVGLVGKDGTLPIQFKARC
jgi:hypothetical protein